MKSRWKILFLKKCFLLFRISFWIPKNSTWVVLLKDQLLGFGLALLLWPLLGKKNNVVFVNFYVLTHYCVNEKVIQA